MWYVCDVLYAVLYVRVNSLVVRGCAVSKRYINVICLVLLICTLTIRSSVLYVLMVKGMAVIIIIIIIIYSIYIALYNALL